MQIPGVPLKSLILETGTDIFTRVQPNLRSGGHSSHFYLLKLSLIFQGKFQRCPELPQCSVALTVCLPLMWVFINPSKLWNCSWPSKQTQFGAYVTPPGPVSSPERVPECKYQIFGNQVHLLCSEEKESKQLRILLHTGYDRGLLGIKAAFPTLTEQKILFKLLLCWQSGCEK